MAKPTAVLAIRLVGVTVLLSLITGGILIGRRSSPVLKPIDKRPTIISASSDSESQLSAASAQGTVPALPQKHEELPLWKTPDKLTWLYSAYYDDREKLFGPAVIVYGFQDSRSETLYHCNIGYQNVSRPLCLKEPAERRMAHGEKWDYKIYGYQYICRLPSSTIPEWVALVPFDRCSPPDDSLNTKIYWLPIKFDRPLQKKKIGICVQSPAYEIDDAQLFPEFIEMHRLLGVEQFTIYIQSMSLEARKVLQEYVTEEIVELVEWNTTLSEGWRVHYYGQLLLINDCLMRNMHTVEYLAFIDRDEVIVPYSQEDWHGMLEQIDTPSTGAFFFDHVFFHKKDDGFSEGFNLSMLGCPTVKPPRYFTFHYRSIKETNHYRLKTIVKPNTISRMTTHEVMDFIPGYTRYFVPSSIAVQHHYRDPDFAPNDSVMLDTKMSKFISPLLSALNKRMCSKNK